MSFRIAHWCIHVLDLEKSLDFYKKALGLHVDHVMGPEDGSWSNTYLKSEDGDFLVELTWNKDRTEPYLNGGKDTHLAFETDDYEAAKKLHQEMGCICFDNERMGLHFIQDPDGSWLEVVPAGKY